MVHRDVASSAAMIGLVAVASIFSALSSLPSASAFAFVRPAASSCNLSLPSIRHKHCNGRGTSTSLGMADGAVFETTVDLPGEGISAQMKFPSVLDAPSELVEVRYQIPFGLDVAPKDQKCVCTKDGAGGERVGDILRYCSQWTLGLPRGDGVITTAMSFSGGISWQVSMFDVMRANKWDDVVEALTSNTQDRTNEVVLIFERPLPDGATQE